MSDASERGDRITAVLQAAKEWRAAQREMHAQVRLRQDVTTERMAMMEAMLALACDAMWPEKDAQPAQESR